MKLVVAAEACVAVCLAACFASAPASAATSGDYGRALNGAAAQLRAAASTKNAFAPNVHVPPAPLPGPPRFSPSLDDWLQAELLHPVRNAKSRKVVLRRVAATLESIAAAQREPVASPRVDAKAEARAILTDPSYQAVELSDKPPPKTWWERFIEWLAGILERLFGGVFRAATAAPKLSEVLAIALLAVVALALVVVIYRFVRAYFLARPRRKPEEIGEIIGPAPVAGTLYAAAREAAARGQFARAVMLLFQAALVALDRARVVPFDAARTAGEYRRMVRRSRPAAFASFDRLAQTFSFAAYAERATNEPEWNDADGAYRALEPLVKEPEA